MIRGIIIIIFVIAGIMVGVGQERRIGNQTKPDAPPATNIRIVSDSTGKGWDRIFTAVEHLAKFPGDFDLWIGNNIFYPEEALENNIQGKVKIRFVVEKDGSLTNMEVLEGVHPALDAEALRVVVSMPKWIPAQHSGRIVRSYYVLPISFSLQGDLQAKDTTDIRTSSTPESTISEKEEIFDSVEFSPVFPGGSAEMHKWLEKNIKYPKAAAKAKVEGMVDVKITIEKDGTVSNPQIVRSDNPLLDKEALRVINLMPKWQPGRIYYSGKEVQETVQSTYIVPVIFRLKR